MRTNSLLLYLLVLLSQVAFSQIIPIDFILDASSTEIHFVRGWLDAPAHVDLTLMRFIATAQPDFVHGDDDDQFGGEFDDAVDDAVDDGFDDDDDDGSGNDDMGSFMDDTVVPQTPAPTAVAPVPAPTEAAAASVTSAPTGITGDNSTLPDDATTAVSPAPSPGGILRRQRQLQNPQRVSQQVDIIFFHVPQDCSTVDKIFNPKGDCAWDKLGVGAYDPEVEGEVTYCCSEDAIARNLCSSDDMGQLIVDHKLFEGDHRILPVPTTPEQDFVMEQPVFNIQQSGQHVLIMANCYDYGLDILAVGSMEWKSVGGYLPGDLFGLMFFFAAMTVYYLLMIIWYWCGMKLYQDASIPIQKYILATMVVGFFELLFRAADFGLWNMQGTRNLGMVYASIGFGVLKRGISRCLGVMVAMGWGVVRDSLGMTLAKIVTLGMVYSALTLARDYMVVFAETEVEKISTTEEGELIDLALFLTPMVIVINLIFYFWIISSLNGTTEFLKNMNQTSKLRRHLRLRCIMLTSIFIAAAWLVFSIVDSTMNILTSDQVWILEGAMHANFLFVLTGVAILWRPNPNAKDYAMQMEVPALGGDDYENELELSCSVPSASDGNDPDHPNGLGIDHAVSS